jgi:hypothetical protein
MEYNLKKLGSTKSMFLKRVLYISKYAPTRLVDALAGTFFMKNMKETYNLPESTPYQRLLQRELCKSSH